MSNVICEQQRRRSAFAVRCLDSIISEISSSYLASVAAQAGWSLPWSETPEESFCRVVAHIHFVKSPCDWNKFPEFMICAKTLDSFKTAVQHTPTNHSHAKPRSIQNVHKRSFWFSIRGAKNTPLEFSELFSLKSIYIKCKNAILSHIDCFFCTWKN